MVKRERFVLETHCAISAIRFTQKKKKNWWISSIFGDTIVKDLASSGTSGRHVLYFEWADTSVNCVHFHCFFGCFSSNYYYLLSFNRQLNWMINNQPVWLVEKALDDCVCVFFLLFDAIALIKETAEFIIHLRSVDGYMEHPE